MVLATLRDRWPLFLGTWVCLGLGIALLQSDLQLIIATSPPEDPRASAYDNAVLADQYAGAATVMGTVIFFAVALTTVIVATSSAFGVRQRMRDLALLRLVGMSARQVRRMLIGESIVVSALALVIGFPLGLFLVDIQAKMIADIGLPDLSEADYKWWYTAIAFAVAALIAILGVYGVARSASKVPPAVALRDTGEASSKLGFGWWLVTIFLVVAFIGLIVGATVAGLVAATAMAIAIGLIGSLAMARLAPLLVPLIASVLSLLMGRGVVPSTAAANIKDAVKRSVSICLPVILLVGMIISLATTMSTVTKAVALDMRDSTNAQAVVALQSPSDAEAIDSAVPGATVSLETEVPLSAELPPAEGASSSLASGIIAIDPANYTAIHEPEVKDGNIEDLDATSIALGPGASASDRELGQDVTLDDGENSEQRTVAAIASGGVNSPISLLVSRDGIDQSILDNGTTQAFVDAEGQEPDAVVAALRDAGIGEVSTIEDWADDIGRESGEANNAVLQAVLAVSGVYCVLAIIIASVFGSSRRTLEFARLRLVGFSRRQVVSIAISEGVGLAIAGLLLGVLVVVGTAIGLAGGTASTLGTTALEIPWGTSIIVALIGFVAVVATTAVAAGSATAARPVDVAMSPE